MSVLYADASALVKLLVREPESPAVAPRRVAVAGGPLELLC